MKFIVKSLIGATALFSVYTAATLTSGYIKMRNFEPDSEGAWEKLENLPSEVAFGQAPFPLLYSGVFAGIMLACALLLVVYEKSTSKNA